MPVNRENLGPSLGKLYDQLDSMGGYLEAQVAQGSAIALTTNTSVNVASLTLDAGDWNIFGVAAFIPGATTSITLLSGGSSLTTGTLDTALSATNAQNIAAVVPTAVPQLIPLPMRRLVLTTQTTIYLVVRAAFTVSTLGAYGIISARKASLQ